MMFSENARRLTLAHLPTRFSQGTRVEMEITVEHHRKRASAMVTRTPFFNPERKRA